MENEFYPHCSKGFRKAASRMVEDFMDETLSPQQKQERFAIYQRNAVVSHFKQWDRTKILDVIAGKAGIDIVADVYADGVNLTKILTNVLPSPQMPISEKITEFLEGVTKEMTPNLLSQIMEKGIPYSSKAQMKALIADSNPIFQKEMAELGQKLSESPNSPLREKPVASKKTSTNGILSKSILSQAFSLKNQRSINNS